MKKTVDISKEINEMRKVPANKKCFECGEIGTTYIVPDFGVFVCSICAGIHREFNHRVKGLSMSNFVQTELDALKRQGNEVCQRTWMARYNPRDFPQPSPKDTQRIKDFIRLKYRERRWYQDTPQESAPQPEPREASVPSIVAKPIAPAQSSAPASAQLGDLLSLGEPQSRPPASGTEGWADFTPTTNQVNIQISFQQPKGEERKQVERPPQANPVQVQVRQGTQGGGFPDQQPGRQEAKKEPQPQQTQPAQFQSPQPVYSQSSYPGTQYQSAPQTVYQQPSEKFAPPQMAYQQPSGPQASPPTNPQPSQFVQGQQAVPQYAVQNPGYQPSYTPQVQNYPVYQQPMKDPFSGLVESDIERQAQKQLGGSGMNLRVLQQQYYSQSQAYSQMYGIAYPYTFQAWCQLMFPKPPGTNVAPQGGQPAPDPRTQQLPPQGRGGKTNNPFDMFG